MRRTNELACWFLLLGLVGCDNGARSVPSTPARPRPDSGAVLPDLGWPAPDLGDPAPDDLGPAPADLAGEPDTGAGADTGPPPADQELAPDQGPAPDAGLTPVPVTFNEAQCQGPDWVELAGLPEGGGLDGWILTDAPDQADHRWAFPPGTHVDAGELLLVPRDETGVHGFPFGLKCGQDTLRLLRPSGEEVEALPLPPLGPGQSWGRLPDGPAGTWQLTRPTPGAPNAPLALEDPSAVIFDPATIHTFELELPAESWAEIRDTPTNRTWHRATFRWGDEVVPEVGVRVFGHGSVVPGKPPLKLSFDEFVAGRTWRGQRELKLDNSLQDPSFLTERVEAAALRRMGLPASRTGWTRVRVNGEPVGFFIILEAIDQVFVQRWYGTDQGRLYAPMTDTWGKGLNHPLDEPLRWYEQLAGAPSDGAELTEIARLVAEGTPEELAAALDLDEFFRGSVARSIMGSVDCFSADGANFRLYHDGTRWHHIPWDLDIDLGGSWYARLFFQTIVLDPRAPWTASPWSVNPLGVQYEDQLLRRQLELGWDPDSLIQELLAGPLAYELLDEELTQAAALIRADVLADPLGYGASFDETVMIKRLWLHTRWTTLAGREVVACPPPDPQIWRAADLSPAATVGWGELVVDGTPLGPGFQVGGEHHCTGLFAHSPSVVTLVLPPGVTVLTGAAGFQDYPDRCGDGALFRIEQDGRILWASAGPIAGRQPAVALGELAIQPGLLNLITEPGGDYLCDAAVWVDIQVQ